MKAHFNSKLIKLIPLIIILSGLCFLFKHRLDQIEEQRNIANEEARILLEQEKQQKYQEHQEYQNQQKEKEEKRILENRVVIEPELTLDGINDLIDKYYVAVPALVDPWTDKAIELINSPIGQTFQAEILTIPENPNFNLLATQQRIFKSLFQYFDPLIAGGKVNVTSDPIYKDTWILYNKLEQLLFPWIRPHWNNLFEIRKHEKAEKGIVMCVGDDQFKHALVSIRSIRENLHSDLPIEIFYINEDDLSEELRDYLGALPGVTLHDISKLMNNDYTQHGGWSIKPYAILASGFSKVLLVDADVFMLQSPEVFFEDEGFKRTGALFFLDRTLFEDFEEGRKWLKSFLPTFSSFVKESRWWKKTSTHEQESGIVMIDKSKALLGLLSTCKLNDKEERDQVSYEHSHGDKETFWVGFEMIQSPYTFIRSFGAVLGGLGDEGDENTVCGNQLHLDTFGRPLWWNGGILRDKNKWDDRYMKFTHFAEGERWVFEDSCISETDKIHELNEHEKEIGAKIIALDMERKENPEFDKYN